MNNKFIFILVGIIFLIPLIIAEDIYSDCSVYGNCKEAQGTGVASNVNYSTVNVNNSNYLEGYNVSSLWSYYSGLGNALWCELTGCTMQGDIDMDNNNIYNIGNIYNKTEVDNNITANSGDSNVAVINNVNTYSTINNVNNSSFPSTALINNIIYSDSTYNATYAQWAYNQTYSGSTFNQTYDNFAYNQTISQVSGSNQQVGFFNASGFLTGSDNYTYNSTVNQITLNRNTAAVSAPTIAGTAFRINGADNEALRIGLTSYGIGAMSAFSTRSARGTGASPTATQAGDLLGQFDAYGRSTSSWTLTPRGIIKIFASENYNDTAQGSYISLWTTPKQTIVPTESMRIDDGNVTIYGNLTMKETNPSADSNYNLGSSVTRWLKGWFVNLDVSGNATITNTLTIGTATIDGAGSLNMSGNLIVGGNFSAKRPYWNGYDNSTQDFLDTGSTQIINISNNNDYDSYLINVEGQQNLTFKQTGDYMCLLSPEFYNTASTAQIAFWFQKTNSTGQFNDVAWTNSRFSMGNAEYNAPSIPFQFDIEDSTRKVRFMWYSTSTNSQIISVAAPTSPNRPGIPGIILNCQKLSELT